MKPKEAHRSYALVLSAHQGPRKSNPTLPTSLAPLPLHYLPPLMLRAEPRPGYFTASRILLLPESRYSLLRVPCRTHHSGTKGEKDAGYVHNRENLAPQKPCGRAAQSSLTVALGPRPRG